MKTTTLGVIRMIDSKLYILTLISVTSLIRPFTKRCFDLSNQLLSHLLVQFVKVAESIHDVGVVVVRIYY